MSGHKIKVPNFRLNKNGKLTKVSAPRNASHAIAQKKSKRVRVAKQGALKP